MEKKEFNTLAYTDLDEFIYGYAKNPVTLKNGMSLGRGSVYPEINFTLPTMMIDEDSMPEVLNHYKEIITGVCDRARALQVPGFVAEIETLPPMTFDPRWGIEVCRTVFNIIKEYADKYNMKAAVRITPNDIREGDLDNMWRCRQWDMMMQTFEGCAKEGADFLAVESVGGKEVHDEAVMYCDIVKSICARRPGHKGYGKTLDGNLDFDYRGPYG